MISHWILLAEDSDNDADLALRILSPAPENGRVVVARDGEEALDCLYERGIFEGRAARGHPSVVLLDLKMPKLDGLEVLRQMRADPKLRSVPVVMFTSSRESTDVARSYDLGVNAYVVKPVEFSRFMAVVNEIRRFWLDTNELPFVPGAQPARAPERAAPTPTFK